MTTGYWRFWVVLLLIIILVANVGCQMENNDHATSNTPIEIIRFDEPWEELTWEKFGIQHTQEINPEIEFDDPGLQKLVKQNVSAIPLNTDASATSFAWDILPALIKCDYLPEGWVPILACHFTNDIWVFCYADGSIDRSGMRDGTIDVYVADNDGHIVFIYV